MYSDCRGHKTIVDEDGNEIFADTKEPCIGSKDKRPCIKCGKEPTEEGHDACLEHLDGMSAVCCGHGIKPGWISSKKSLGKETDEVLNKDQLITAISKSNFKGNIHLKADEFLKLMKLTIE